MNASNSSFEAKYHYNWTVTIIPLLIIVTAIAGNSLVLCSVFREKRLRNRFNYFLASLATSDLISALLVMPLALFHLMTGNNNIREPYWVCTAWYALDVLTTTSSISHMTMFAIDRYRAINQPLTHNARKSMKNTLCHIASVWVSAAAIAGPLFLFSMYAQQTDHVNYKGCGPESQLFIILATTFSFYCPLCVMTIMFALTVHSLMKQMRRSKEADTRSRHSTRVTVTLESHRPRENNGLLKSHSTNACEEATPMQEMSLLSASRQPWSANGLQTSHKQSLSTADIASVFSDFNSSEYVGFCDTDNPTREHTTVTTETAIDDNRENIEFGDNASIQSNNSVVHTFKSKRSSRKKKSSKKQKKKRKKNCSERKSMEAIRVLAVLLVVFYACYLPFFITYLIKATSNPSSISDTWLNLCEWIGYCGSAINPIMYHIFNKQFRSYLCSQFKCRGKTRHR